MSRSEPLTRLNREATTTLPQYRDWLEGQTPNLLEEHAVIKWMLERDFHPRAARETDFEELIEVVTKVLERQPKESVGMLEVYMVMAECIPERFVGTTRENLRWLIRFDQGLKDRGSTNNT